MYAKHTHLHKHIYNRIYVRIYDIYINRWRIKCEGERDREPR